MKPRVSRTHSERSEGTPHTPGCSHLFCGDRVPGLALGISASRGLCGISPALAGNVGAGWAFARPRDGGSGCRRSYARCGPIPLPPGAPSGIRYVAKSRFFSTGWDWVPCCVLVCTRVRGDRRLGPATRIRILTTNPGPRQGHGFCVTLSGRNLMEGVNEQGIHAGTFIGSPVAILSAMPVPHP